MDGMTDGITIATVTHDPFGNAYANQAVRIEGRLTITGEEQLDSLVRRIRQRMGLPTHDGALELLTKLRDRLSPARVEMEAPNAGRSFDAGVYRFRITEELSSEWSPGCPVRTRIMIVERSLAQEHASYLDRLVDRTVAEWESGRRTSETTTIRTAPPRFSDVRSDDEREPPPHG